MHIQTIPGRMFRFASLMVLLAPAACDGPADDDDTIGDDDDTGDDDSADDDDDATAWADLLPEQDPEGDHGGSPLDIQSLQYALDDGLALRLLGWEPFDDQDGDLWVGMTVGTAERATRLTWIPADPDPLQVWSSANRWGSPLPLPDSSAMDADADTALVLSTALADLGLEGRCEALGQVEVGCDGSTCADVAPDDGVPVEFSLDADLPASLASPAVLADDSSGGDGDGIVDPGEYLDLSVSLGNVGCEETGPSLTATLSLHPSSTAEAALLDDAASYGGGALAPGASVTPDATVSMAVGAGAEPGQRLVLQLDVVDGDGGSYSVVSPALVLGKPREVALAQLFADGDDTELALDVALVGYGVIGSELQISLFSYGVHQGDEEVEIHLDTDRDGYADVILSTVDPDTGGMTGGVLTFDPWMGWVSAAPPATMVYAPNSDQLVLGIPLAELGDPDFVLLTEVRVIDDAGDPADQVPDAPLVGDTSAAGVIALVDGPYLRYADVQLLEQEGDGDEGLDAGETWTIKIQLRNDGPADAIDATGTLTGAAGLVQVADGELSFGPADGGGGTAWSLTAATLTLDGDAEPGTGLGLSLAGAVAGYGFEVELPLSVAGGAAR
jgi:hypothetical protein